MISRFFRKLVLLALLMSVNPKVYAFNFLSTTLPSSSCVELAPEWRPQSASLIGYWKLNETVGTTTITDSSASSISGTAANITMGATGKLNTAASFSAGARQINMGTSATLRPAFPFTVSSWVRLTSYPGSHQAPILASNETHADYGKYRGFSVSIGPSGEVIGEVGGAAALGSSCTSSGRLTAETAAAVISLNKWHHIAVVFTSASGRTIYVDGIARSLTNSGSAANIVYGATNELHIGHGYIGTYGACGGNQIYLSGLIDEVAFWSVALTSAEVRKIHDQQSCGRN